MDEKYELAQEAYELATCLDAIARRPENQGVTGYLGHNTRLIGCTNPRLIRIREKASQRYYRRYKAWRVSR